MRHMMTGRRFRPGRPGRPVGMEYPPDRDEETHPEQGEPGAEGGDESDASDEKPAAPADDSSPLGDTDQHSNA